MKISLIVTTKNESRTISKLLDSIAKQTRRPDEVIIANAMTADSKKPTAYSGEVNLKWVEVPADTNRAVGRNTAIRAATYDNILITDAGCTLKEDWVEKMIQGFKEKGKGESAEVVAGFYEGVYENLFEKCEIPYVLVMPDKLNTATFLPATRSMGLSKSAWEQLGGFNESYRYSEDYEFARRIREKNIPITVVPEAIVYWRPRKDLWSFARMIFEHAYGDAFSHTFRPKVLTIYIRYAIFLACSLQLVACSVLLLAFYFSYAIWKNYRYVHHWKACVYLPLLQISSDFAVMAGTIGGVCTRVFRNADHSKK